MDSGGMKDVRHHIRNGRIEHTLHSCLLPCRAAGKLNRRLTHNLTLTRFNTMMGDPNLCRRDR